MRVVLGFVNYFSDNILKFRAYNVLLYGCYMIIEILHVRKIKFLKLEKLFVKVYGLKLALG